MFLFAKQKLSKLLSFKSTLLLSHICIKIEYTHQTKVYLLKNLISLYLSSILCHMP